MMVKLTFNKTEKCHSTSPLAAKLLSVAMSLMVVFGLISVMGEAGVGLPEAQALHHPTYYCSLELQNSNGDAAVKIENHRVQIRQIAYTDSDDESLTEAFEGMNRVLQEAGLGSVHFMVKTTVKNRGGETVPELKLGIYSYNKFAANKRALQAGATGDARAFVDLTTQLFGTTRQVKFVCRNAETVDI